MGIGGIKTIRQIRSEDLSFVNNNLGDSPLSFNSNA
jgi:hypothetical protein